MEVAGDVLVRYNLRHLLIGVALIALVLGLTMSIGRLSRRAFDCHQVSSLAFSPDGTKLAVVHFRGRWGRWSGTFLGDVSRTVALFDTSDLTRRTLVQHDFRPGFDQPQDYWSSPLAPIGFTEQGNLLLVLDRGEGSIRVWDVSSGTWTTNHALSASDVLAFDLSVDGKTLTVCRRSRVATIWDTDSWTRLTPPPVSVWSGRSSPDGKYWAHNDRQGVHVWDLHNGKIVRTFHNNHDVQGRVTFKEFSPDGDIVAVRRQTGLHMCSLSTGLEKRVNLDEYVEIPFGPEQKTTRRHKASTIGIAFSPDGRLLAAWGKYGLRFFDKSQGWKLQREVADRTTNCLEFSPDGKTYATGDEHGKVAIWDTVTGKEVRSQNWF